jgi:hypothetical protein
MITGNVLRLACLFSMALATTVPQVGDEKGPWPTTTKVQDIEKRATATFSLVTSIITVPVVISDSSGVVPIPIPLPTPHNPKDPKPKPDGPPPGPGPKPDPKPKPAPVSPADPKDRKNLKSPITVFSIGTFLFPVLNVVLIPEHLPADKSTVVSHVSSSLNQAVLKRQR